MLLTTFARLWVGKKSSKKSVDKQKKMCYNKDKMKQGMEVRTMKRLNEP